MPSIHPPIYLFIITIPHVNGNLGLTDGVMQGELG